MVPRRASTQQSVINNAVSVENVRKGEDGKIRKASYGAIYEEPGPRRTPHHCIRLNQNMVVVFRSPLVDMEMIRRQWR